jgi:hypothetical protein
VDLVLETIWVAHSSRFHDFLDDTLPLDEAILEAIPSPDRTWDNLHRRSYFVPELERIEHDDFMSTLSEMVGHAVVPLDTHGIYVEGNMENICPIVMINIYRTPGKIENVYISENCFLEEIKIYIDIFKEL